MILLKTITDKASIFSYYLQEIR